MRRSKRKSKSDYASQPAPARIESNKIPKILKASRRGLRVCTVSNSEELWHHCIGRMVPHNWYRIIPKNNDSYDDISFSMGQSWDLILPILIDLGYINRTSNSLNIIYTRFLNLRHELNKILDIHISDNHPKGKKRQYYMCLNKQNFSGPTK